MTNSKIKGGGGMGGGGLAHIKKKVVTGMGGSYLVYTKLQ